MGNAIDTDSDKQEPWRRGGKEREQAGNERHKTKQKRTPAAKSIDKRPTDKRPATLAAPITESSMAAKAGVMPRSMPCTTMCSGMVVRVVKKENCMAQNIQKVRLRRAS